MNHFITKIEERKSQRDWKSLPTSFEMDAVRAMFQTMKPHFGKHQIKQRIKASKAVTFDELIDSISK